MISRYCIPLNSVEKFWFSSHSVVPVINVTPKLPSWSQMARILAGVERKTLPRIRVSSFGSFESDTIFIAAILPWLRIHRSVRLWGLCLINPCDK